MNPNQKTRINAAISYFGLAALFLMAKKNPDFNDPFIQKHSKNAVKLHILFVLFYILLHWFGLLYVLPIVGSALLHKVLSIFLFSALILYILYGALHAYEGKLPNVFISEDKKKRLFTTDTIKQDESEKFITILSYIPLVGLLLTQKDTFSRKSNIIFVGYITALLGLYAYTYGISSSSFHALLLVYTIFLGFIGTLLFIQNTQLLFPFADRLPNLQTIYLFIRTIIAYIFRNIYNTLTGKKFASFWSTKNSLAIAGAKKEKEFQKTHSNTKIFGSKYLIYIPIINIIYIKYASKSSTSYYKIAILQGLILTLLTCIHIIFSTNIFIFVIFAVFLGLGNLAEKPYYRIPIVYELSVLLEYISFGQLGMLPTEKKEVTLPIKK